MSLQALRPILTHIFTHLTVQKILLHPILKEALKKLRGMNQRGASLFLALLYLIAKEQASPARELMLEPWGSQDGTLI